MRVGAYLMLMPGNRNGSDQDNAASAWIRSFVALCWFGCSRFSVLTCEGRQPYPAELRRDEIRAGVWTLFVVCMRHDLPPLRTVLILSLPIKVVYFCTHWSPWRRAWDIFFFTDVVVRGARCLQVLEIFVLSGPVKWCGKCECFHVLKVWNHSIFEYDLNADMFIWAAEGLKWYITMAAFYVTLFVRFLVVAWYAAIGP